MITSHDIRCLEWRDFEIYLKSGKDQHTRVYPYPLGAGSARPNLKMGAPDPGNPLFLGFSVLRGGLRPWSRKGPDLGVGVDPETVKRAPRGTKPIHAGKISWGINICANTCGACIRTPANTGKYFEEVFPSILPNS